MTSEYIHAAETAVIIRRKLKEQFPGTKFYVRSETFAGGSAINVYYDGATIGENGFAVLVEVDFDGIPTGRPLPDDFPQRGRAGHLPKPGTPRKKDVENVVLAYRGGGFDGMIDMEYSSSIYLDADDNVVGSYSSGTYGSRGTVPAWSDPAPDGARLVHPLAKYLSVEDVLPYDVREKTAVR